MDRASGPRIDRMLEFCRRFSAKDKDTTRCEFFAVVAPESHMLALYAMLHTLSLHNSGAHVYVMCHEACRTHIENVR